LALIQVASNRHDEAEKSMEKARKAWYRGKESYGQTGALASFCLIQSWSEFPTATQNGVEVCEMARELVHDHPASPTAWYWLAETSLRLGRKEDAHSAMRKVNRLRRQPTIDDELLGMLVNDGRIDTEKIRTEVVTRFGIEELPFGTHAKFLLENLMQNH
jgi:hypothetical protein